MLVGLVHEVEGVLDGFDGCKLDFKILLLLVHALADAHENGVVVLVAYARGALFLKNERGDLPWLRRCSRE